MTNKSMSNNCKNEGFGMQRSEDNLLRILIESIIIFVQSSGVFTQSSNELTHLADVWSQLVDKLTQLVDEWAKSTKRVRGE
jgi:hypothetical protein